MIFTLFILGLIVGSFLNVCIYRIPRRKSILFPQSHCTFCNAKLKPIDLVPVLSYMLLGGRCRYCRSRISAVYPIVELVSGTNFAVLFLMFGSSIQFYFFTIMFSVLIMIFFIDLKYLIVPDSLVVIGVFVSIFFNLFRGELLFSLIGMLAGFTIMYIILVFGNYLFKKEATGFGDVTVSAMLGAMLGWPNILVSLFFSYLIAAVVSIPLLILKLKRRDDIIPFGPFLVLGGVITVFWGNAIINWYFNLL